MSGLTVVVGAATAPVYGVGPSLDLCRVCERRGVFDVAAPEFPATPTVF